MTVISNSVNFTVLDSAELPGTGWTVQVLGAPDYTDVIAHIPHYVELTVGPELNRVGEGSITLDLDDEALWTSTLPGGQPGTYLLDREHLWRCTQDGVNRFDFLGTNVEEQIVDAAGTRTVVISGPGSGEVLRWAKVFPPGFPAWTPTTDPSWPFTGKPVMQAYLYLLFAAQARGAIPWVQARFGKEGDAGGVAWDDLHTAKENRVEFAPAYGTDLLALIDEVTGQDATKPAGTRADWRMRPGFKLEVRKVIGARREKHVVFHEPALESKSRTRTRSALSNYVVLADDKVNTTPVSDSASMALFGRRELWETGAYGTTIQARVANNLLQQHKIEKSSWTLKVPYDEPGRAVFVDYNMGDWIGVMRYNGGAVANNHEAYRVIGIVVKVGESGQPDVELELESRLDAKLRQLQLDLTKLVNNYLNVTVPGPPDNKIEPLPNYKTVPCWNYKTKKWAACDVLRDTDFPDVTLPGGGNASGGRPRVFISVADPTLNPANTVSVGDFWVELED